MECTECIDGYYLEDYKTCTKITYIDNCKKANSDGICTECLDNFVKVTRYD